MNTKIKWILVTFLIANIILALIPDFSESIGRTIADWNSNLRIAMLFLFDPAKYVWKWIIGLLIAVIFVIQK